jgi:hypothetical protein
MDQIESKEEDDDLLRAIYNSIQEYALSQKPDDQPLVVVIGASRHNPRDNQRWGNLSTGYVGVSANLERYDFISNGPKLGCGPTLASVAVEYWNRAFWETRLPKAIEKEKQTRDISLFVDRATVTHIIDSLSEKQPLFELYAKRNVKSDAIVAEMIRIKEAAAGVFATFCGKVATSVTVVVTNYAPANMPVDFGESFTFIEQLLQSKLGWTPTPGVIYLASYGSCEDRTTMKFCAP